MEKKKLIKWIFGILCAVILFYIAGACFPFLSLPRITQEKKAAVDVEGFYGEEVSVDRAVILETNKSAWEERLRLLDRAKERIILSTFDMRQGESTRDILAVLYAAAERGVDVKILVDGISGFLRMEGEPLFYVLSTHPNAEIRLYNPVCLWKPWTLAGRMHDKYVLADDEGYILGGRNMFDYFIGEYAARSRSYDRDVLVYNTASGTPRTGESSCTQIESYFESLWDSKECRVFHKQEEASRKEELLEQKKQLQERYAKLKGSFPELFDAAYDYKENTSEVNKISLVSNPTHIYGKEPEVFIAMQRLMASARDRVVIHTPYIALNKDMEDGLREISGEVEDFSMLLNAVENGDNFFGSSDYVWRKGRVMDTGIQLYEFAGGDSYHGKSILIDDRLSVIGSYNLDMRSTYVDTELMLVIDSRKLNQELYGYMEEMKARSKKVISETEYELPQGFEAWEAPLWKRMLWKITGFLMAPFRFTV